MIVSISIQLLLLFIIEDHFNSITCITTVLYECVRETWCLYIKIIMVVVCKHENNSNIHMDN